MQRNIYGRIATSISQALQTRTSLPKYYSDSSTATSATESKPESQPAAGGSKNTKSSKNAPIRKAKTPIGKLDELEEGKHPFQEKEPLPPFPNNTNPVTGEIGGPRGPEPTRYGDWERKGRVTDF